MNVVFEGILSKPWGTQDILRAILDLKEVRYGVLRLSIPEENVQGRIVFADKGHIVDASISGRSDTGGAYESLRQLLSFHCGSYVFLDSGMNRPAEFTESLYIPAERIIALLPNLPENPTDLFDEKSLLDKIFGSSNHSAGDSCENVKYKNFTPPETEPTTINQPYAQRWEAMEPLFGNQTPSSYPLPDSALPDTEELDQQRQSMTRLRGLPVQHTPSIFNILRQRASVLFSVAVVFAAAMTALVNPRFMAGISQLTGGASNPLKQALRTSSQ